MTSKQVTSPPWNSRRLVHSKEMAWASRWSVALRAFYRQILSSSNCKDFFFKWHRPPRKLAKEVFVKFIPAKEKTRFAKEWRKVLAKDHVIRIDSHEVFNTAHIYNVFFWIVKDLLKLLYLFLSFSFEIPHFQKLKMTVSPQWLGWSHPEKWRLRLESLRLISRCHAMDFWRFLYILGWESIPNHHPSLEWMVYVNLHLVDFYGKCR